MGNDVLGFDEIDQTQVALVGGKGASLGELARIDGIRVPRGFCLTTAAFLRIMASAPAIDEALDRLAQIDPGDRDGIRTRAAELRKTIEAIAMPDDLAAAITGAVARLGEHVAYAVRSSATAEDLPTASFAGQQDTFLNVVGSAAILEHVSRCWASLFTERAVTYRLREGIDHRQVHMAVVIQQMVIPQASGILFTADPVNGNRQVEFVDASFGLGEAVVSGLVNPDVFKVRDGEIVQKIVASKQLAIEALPGGGTQHRAIDPASQTRPALTDTQVVELARLGRRIEAHFGRPQDIEWCLVDDDFHIVQSRPITTLFPIPAAADDAPRVYVSVGHQQMMTDAMKPLGISMWQLTAAAPMHAAGGRLFVDVSHHLASPTNRDRLVASFAKSDPLTGDALRTIVERDFIPLVSDDGPVAQFLAPPDPIETDPAIVDELIATNRASVAALRRAIESKTGSALIDAILEDIQEMKRILFEPRSFQVFMLAMEAAGWLNEHLEEWLGDKNVADTLTQSVPNNVTSEMGLALLDVADAIRPHPDVIAFLRRVDDDDFLDELSTIEGGPQAQAAIGAYIDEYGMRCVGEIDITRPRWSERPSMLVPVILANIENFEAGEGTRRFEQGRVEAEAKEREVLERLRALPDGDAKADETKQMIDRVRTFIGYREYPKYGMVSRYFVYKQALLGEAERLVRAGVLREAEDVFFLTFPEIEDVVRTQEIDSELIRERKEAFASYHALTPPRVFTSEGEAVAGSYRRKDVPAGALVGLPVSAGTIEGRARVIVDIEQAD
ncbi:MAG TPA: rifamycin-inactivating phosphotransferase, partial [Streptosporangiaceae bacterium]|nr:rifamycin-inactivating phosphotransferase [Streptosporangiaceae bacterium]